MSTEGTPLCKIFGGARKIRGRDSDQGAKLQNPRQISQICPALLTYRASNPSTQDRRAAGAASACTAQTELVPALP